MSAVTINILKKSVMGVVEGLTATIAQHNPEVDFNTMWASDSEESKIDVYYREAITDLENHLSKWTSSTTTQYDLQALADDLKFTVRTLAYWPPRLSGLLSNQVQNYLVHAIMAGWLSDFPDVKCTDYASMGSTDLDAIKEILLKKDFSFAEFGRVEDTDAKNGNDEPLVHNRTADSEGKEGNDRNITWNRVDDKDRKTADASSNTSSRTSDINGKENRSTNTADRSSDSDTKSGTGTNAGSRNSDSESKNQSSGIVSSRGEDNTDKSSHKKSSVSGRHKDEERQCFREEQVDWGGGFPPFILR